MVTVAPEIHGGILGAALWQRNSVYWGECINEKKKKMGGAFKAWRMMLWEMGHKSKSLLIPAPFYKAF